MPVSDELIKTVTIFFVLSMVCERLAEFLKYWTFSNKSVLNLNVKFTEGSKEEIKRKHNILKLNILLGFITAFLCHASLFDILSGSPEIKIGWSKLSLNSLDLCSNLDCILGYVGFFVGCALTGAFISTGSKFWHDTLDVLLIAKNMKRTDNTSNFDSLTKDEQQSKIQSAIIENGKRWMATIPNITGISIANKEIQKDGLVLPQKVIQFQVTKKLEINEVVKLIPTHVEYGGYKIPTDVVVGGVIDLNYKFPGDGPLPKKCGASISRTENQETGTISFKLWRTEEDETKKVYLLTCAHVLMNAEIGNGIEKVTDGKNITNSPKVICPGLDTKIPGSILGRLTEGTLNEFTDSALVLLENPNILDSDIYSFGIPQGPKAVGENDIGSLRLKFCGAFSGIVTDRLLKGICRYKKANYKKDRPHTFDELLQIEKCSIGGDSGAAVMDSNNNVVGIILGSDTSFTYIIPIQNILSEHQHFEFF